MVDRYERGNFHRYEELWNSHRRFRPRASAVGWTSRGEVSELLEPVRLVAASSKSTLTTCMPPQVLYRGPWLLTTRLLVRFKLTQLAGATSLCTLPFLSAPTEALPPLAQAGLGLLAGGAGATSLALFFFSRRYVGELALLPGTPPLVRISSFGFWGERVDTTVPLAAVQRPFAGLTREERVRASRELLLPLDVVGQRQFVLSPRCGTVKDGAALDAFLSGRDDSIVERSGAVPSKAG